MGCGNSNKESSFTTINTNNISLNGIGIGMLNHQQSPYHRT
jgi:hypothetical protein